MKSHDEIALMRENDIINSREQMAKKPTFVTAELLLEAYTANLKHSASLIQSE